jgi:hypothetical protein
MFDKFWSFLPFNLIWMQYFVPIVFNNRRKKEIIIFHSRISHLSSDLVSIQIDNGRKSRRLLRIVQELLPTFKYDDDESAKFGALKSGWANGYTF